MNKKIKDNLAIVIFASRWLQMPLYLGLICVQGIYVYQFCVELWHLFHKLGQGITESEIMLSVLGLIDVVMIANLLVMVLIGGYETFVTKMNLENNSERPEWLDHVNAGILKVKLSTAIIGISSIHLLKTFINAANLDNHTIMWQSIIHVIFLFSAIAMVYVDKIMNLTLHQTKNHD